MTGTSQRPTSNTTAAAARQGQFLEVISREEAMARFTRHLSLQPLGVETVSLSSTLNRVLAEDVVSPVDVPGFDRSNVDGFAVHAADTYGAMEEQPRRVRLTEETVSPGEVPRITVEAGRASLLATGAMLPRGADAVVMVEDTEVLEVNGEVQLHIYRPVTPGQNISFAGTDIACGETVLRGGCLLTSREIGVLAAIGRSTVTVCRRPRVALLSTGNEIVPPGSERPPGFVYDSNLAILSAAVEELGCEPIRLGIVRDEEQKLQQFLRDGLQYDAVVLSGGTSKGAGDLSYRAVSRLKNPGIVVHGVALKPGKPICLAVTDGKPVVILPGFPTSAIFTFHEFVAPVLRKLAGRRETPAGHQTARLPMRINSERGRTEYLLVRLVQRSDGLAAYPLGKGSGSVTTFSTADGFITIPAQTEIVEAGSTVDVRLLGEQILPADLVAIGSHCVGLDYLLGELERRGCVTKVLHVGSQAGLTAARRGECDLAGIHLLDPETGQYNRPFLTDNLKLIPGYGRMQGIVFRPGDSRFVNCTPEEALARALADPRCRMVNRNAGSGTRLLIDELLQGKKPPGYALQPKSHNAVAAAVRQERADWGVCIETVARTYGLAFLPLREERYDFLVPAERWDRPAVRLFRDLLREPAIRTALREKHFRPYND